MIEEQHQALKLFVPIRRLQRQRPQKTENMSWVQASINMVSVAAITVDQTFSNCFAEPKGSAKDLKGSIIKMWPMAGKWNF
jgi:hypothetical protein